MNSQFFIKPITLECEKIVDEIKQNVDMDFNPYFSYELTALELKQFENLVTALKTDMPALQKIALKDNDSYAANLYNLIYAADQKYSPKRFMNEIILLAVNNRLDITNQRKESDFHYLPNVTLWFLLNKMELNSTPIPQTTSKVSK